MLAQQQHAWNEMRGEGEVASQLKPTCGRSLYTSSCNAHCVPFWCSVSDVGHSSQLVYVYTVPGSVLVLDCFLETAGFWL
jgi:hypothetical protein